jgi:hypothetical protein
MDITGQRGTYTLPSEPHAKGGQARVFRATTASGEVVAVKLASSKGADGAWMDRERDELERLNRNHPDPAGHIVPMFDYGVSNGGFQ